MIPNWIDKATPVVTLLLVALVWLPAESATKKAPLKGTGNPLDLLNGYWLGGGTVAPGKGNPEDVSAGSPATWPAVQSRRTCAARAHGLQVQHRLQAHVQGETTCDAAGSGSGTAAGDMVHAIISSDKFSGRMSINVSDSSHTINIVQFDQIGLLSAGRECFAASLGLKGEDQREYRFTGAPMAG
jgi:hypothetical protein